MTTVVKVISNQNGGTYKQALATITEPNSPHNSSYNSNSSAQNKNHVNNNNNPQIARIHSNGSQYPTMSAPAAHAYNINPIMSSSTNYSIHSSMQSDSLLPNATASSFNASSTTQQPNVALLNNFQPNNANQTGQNESTTFNASNNTILSNSSIAIIDVNNSSSSSIAGSSSMNSKKNTNNMILMTTSVDTSNEHNRTEKISSDSMDAARLIIKSNENYFYPPTNMNNTQPKAALLSEHKRGGAGVLNSDSVKYKFKSNETIGLKNNNGEFDDINIKNGGGAKLSKCAKCFKCCSVM
jgi:hypothetical protein